MEFLETAIAGAFEIRPGPRAEDHRGSFARLFCRESFARAGLEADIRQINQSRTRRAGAIRGMHFQRAPMAEVKMVRCTKGAVFDVAIDLRAGSPGFGRWHAIELRADELNTFYIPKGCAHGFQALTDDAELLYFMTADYSPRHEGGLRFDDPDVAVAWPREVTELSERDRELPFLLTLTPIRL